ALWESGFLTPQMSQAEIARVYYDWICVNCTYDINADDDSLSHLPYSLFHDGVAVCDGYTAAYNLLLKLEGIACYALPNSDHIWTVAVLDGREVHIDTTWGDLGNFSDGHFFAMSPQQSYKAHPW
ncbi:MAG: surface layer protein, partial [Oscillibacter sp.]|nr:surface layer protein [Oscillibacter sp.]